ncbi:hypothetical protein ACFL35_20355, partial [Candidatus Riflebacteria bacterium]
NFLQGGDLKGLFSIPAINQLIHGLNMVPFVGIWQGEPVKIPEWKGAKDPGHKRKGGRIAPHLRGAGSPGRITVSKGYLPKVNFFFITRKNFDAKGLINQMPKKGWATVHFAVSNASKVEIYVPSRRCKRSNVGINDHCYDKQTYTGSGSWTKDFEGPRGKGSFGVVLKVFKHGKATAFSTHNASIWVGYHGNGGYGGGGSFQGQIAPSAIKVPHKSHNGRCDWWQK